MERVICSCGHLGVDCGEIGTIISNAEDFQIVVKWNNGTTEEVQLDMIEFLTNRNKKAYIVSWKYFERLFLNKVEANKFLKEKISLNYSAQLQTINL